jgi:hypothetical protein
VWRDPGLQRREALGDERVNRAGLAWGSGSGWALLDGELPGCVPGGRAA